MIWCVEDDASIRDIEIYTLRATGYEAQGFPDGESFFAGLKKELPDLVLLDVMLPGEDGLSILQRLRSDSTWSRIPVIMATAKGTEYDKIQSLEMGADDYLVKPFGMMEMVARVKAVLRRAGTKPDGRLRFEGLVLDPAEHLVTADGDVIVLTLKEFELLRLFLSNPGGVFSREQLLARIWGQEYTGETRTVDVHIRTLRVKLGKYGEHIGTIRGVGYRWETDA